tara:strand:+ start:84 stop:524 length:441 start_codon:yes stop_codon:yes gene_type:complete
MKANLKGDTRDLEKFRKKMLRLRNFGTKDFIRVAQDVAAVAVRYAQGRVPVQTGDLKRSIYSKREGNSVFIEAEMDYAGNVEFGTNPHVIRVRKAKSLYSGKTKQFFGKQVNHPGSAPKPYFFNSIRDATRQTEQRMNKKFKNIVR